MNSIMQHFEFKHLPSGLKEVSEACANLALEMENNLSDGPEKSAGLRKLLEAKDCFVRQKRLDQIEAAKKENNHV